nr:hypothetical protein [Micromonospora sp. DSM 115978]
MLAALAAGLLLATACGSSDDDGGDDGSSGDATTSAVLGPVAQASGTPVRVGVISDGQSPAGDLTYELDTAEATAEYLNEHRSGIDGRPVELVTCEALADPA